MRFTLLDRIVEVDPGKSITAVKAVSLSEEYLADHFPRFSSRCFHVGSDDSGGCLDDPSGRGFCK